MESEEEEEQDALRVEDNVESKVKKSIFNSQDCTEEKRQFCNE